jgi:hypothetical protein
VRERRRRGVVRREQQEDPLVDDPGVGEQFAVLVALATEVAQHVLAVAVAVAVAARRTSSQMKTFAAISSSSDLTSWKKGTVRPASRSHASSARKA